ncbi:PAS domain-containing hybrid sensor histidine kinase/response regulator [Hymenobacter fodinae]|uniref:Sensory/regulatory protein RpfC n=1 Tax=Hymenobacter fodinae TaxID=2510796 RepID=A0A4Z0P4T4_9BACT|nr:PAS domain-containing protein [Hymenobacter fodinae]TGE06572.1 PAS domain S-box protein [Hymenobacter fodinae]
MEFPPQMPSDIQQAHQRIAELERALQLATTTSDALSRQLGQLTAHGQTGWLLTNEVGIIILLNDQFCTLYGLPSPASRWLGHLATELLPELALRVTEPAVLEGSWQLGGTVRSETVVLTSGAVLLQEVAQEGEKNAPLANLHICLREITGQHRQLQELQRVASIPHENINPIFRVGPAGELSFANPAAHQLYEPLPEEERQQMFAQIHRMAAEALAAGTVTEVDVAVARQQHTAFVVPFPAEGYVNIYLVNITARVQVEQQLAEQRAFYETILDRMPSQIAVFDLEQRYRYLNAFALPSLAAREQLLGQGVAAFTATQGWPAAIAENRQRQFALAVQERRMTVWEEEVELPSGAKQYAMRHYQPIFDEAGAVESVIGYGSDITLRREAENRTSANEAKMRALFSALPDTILVLDAEGRVQEAKPGSTPLGHPGQELEGAALAELLPPTVAHRLMQLVSGPPQSEVQEEAFELTHPDGTVTYHNARLVALRDASQLLVLTNTTREETARRELQEQQQFIQLVLDTSPSVIFVRDAKGAVLFQNRATEALRSLSAHLQDNSPLDPNSVQAREMARYAETDAHVLSTGEQYTYESSVTLYSGEVLWFQAVKRPLRLPDGSLHVLVVSTDITALKKAQQTLEHNEKQYRDLMQYSQALICTHDLSGKVLSVNPAVAQFMGLPAESLPGRYLQEALLPAQQAKLGHYLTAIARDGENRGVVEIPFGHDEVRYVLYQNYLVKEDGGRPAYVIGYGQDITDRVLAEQELKRAKDEAEAAVRSRENFLANMSHEIRTPMNGVMGMATQLSKTPLDARQQEFLRIIRSSGQHLLSIINDVLDMAKITSGKLEFEQAPFNLCDSMGQALQPLVHQAIEKGLEVEGTPLRNSCPHPWVLGDPYRINQILINLVGNAIKFTPPGGRITVISRQIAETQETLTVELIVADTGIGIAPAFQARIFEGFTQAYADTTRRFGGTGLGLSISKALVEQLGGQLRLESAVGQGSRFSFELTLPRTTAVAAAATPAPFDAGALQGRRVLLVEDNEINRHVARLLLEEWGMMVDEAENGPAGLALYSVNAYDVVLMDIQMPGMSGLEATAIIRKLPDAAKANVPILALTANAFRADNERYLAAGMDACLTKPFEEGALYRELEWLLRPTEQPAPVVRSYNLSKLHEMAQGHSAFVSKIIRSFLSNMPQSLAKLEAAAAAADWKQAAGVAHHIKPSLDALGIVDVTEAVQQLERAPTSAEKELPAIQRAVTQVISQVQRALVELPIELPTEETQR